MGWNPIPGYALKVSMVSMAVCRTAGEGFDSPWGRWKAVSASIDVDQRSLPTLSKQYH